MKMIKIEKNSKKDEIDKLKEGWNELLKRIDSITPFLSFDWINCCINASLKKNKLTVISILEDSKLIGIAPLWIYREKIRQINVNIISFIKSPDTPFVDFIIENDRNREVIELIIGYLINIEKKDWDIFNISPMPRDSKNLKVVIDIIKEKKIKYYNDFSIITPYVKIESNWNEFLRSHSQRFRKRYRNIVNRIEKLNNLEIKCVKNNDEISILKDVIEVSRNSWKEKEGIAISSKPYTLKFYEDLTKYVGKSGYLLLWLLKTNDIPIAMEYDIIYNDTVFALRSDFDQKYKSYSPGAYLEYKIISYLHENNFREYNTGPGLNQYKLNLCKHTHENKNFNLCNSNLKGLAIFSLNKIIVPIIKIIINKKK